MKKKHLFYVISYYIHHSFKYFLGVCTYVILHIKELIMNQKIYAYCYSYDAIMLGSNPLSGLLILNYKYFGSAFHSNHFCYISNFMICFHDLVVYLFHKARFTISKMIKVIVPPPPRSGLFCFWEVE